MKICTTCGANLADDTDVCPNDGTPLFATAAAIAKSTRTDVPARLDDDDAEDATMAVDAAGLPGYADGAAAPGDEEESTMAVDVSSVLDRYRQQQEQQVQQQRAAQQAPPTSRMSPSSLLERLKQRQATQQQPDPMGDLPDFTSDDGEEPTMAMSVGDAMLEIDARAKQMQKPGRRIGGEESTLSVDYLDDDLMAEAAGPTPSTPAAMSPRAADPMAALAAAGLLKGGTSTSPVRRPFTAPPLDEPTIQMAEDDQQEFKALAKKLINQSNIPAATKGPVPDSPEAVAAMLLDVPAEPAPTAPAAPQTAPVPEPEADELLVDFDSDSSDDEAAGDEEFVDFDDPSGDSDDRDDDAPLDLSMPDDEDDEDEDEDEEPIGAAPLDFGDDAPSPGPQSSNVALSSLINETLAEEGSDLHALPRAAPLAFGSQGVMTSPEQDAPPVELDLPAPKKFRRAKQATSRVLIGLFIVVALLGSAIGVYYYLLPELGYESPYIVPILDDYFP